MNEAFVYCWTDKLYNKLYVGMHKGLPSDGYICSSKLMLSEHNKRPNDFTRQIIAEGNIDDMLSLETAILKSVDAKNDKQFYNMHNGNGKFILKGHTEETRILLSELRSDKPLTDEHKNAISTGLQNSKKARGDCKRRVGNKNGMFGVVRSDDWKKTHSDLLLSMNRKDSNETREKKSIARLGDKNPNYGKISSERGKRWYHDPIVGKSNRFIEGQQPIGWVLGRKKNVH